MVAISIFGNVTISYKNNALINFFEEIMFDKTKDNTKESLARHVAGVTVRHNSPFADLDIIENAEPLSRELITKYVVPFYLGSKDTDAFRKNYLALKDSINIELVSSLLGDFDWRPRSVGAYFAALGCMNELEENIGNLLLRSDVCYAGHDYCLALASFSSSQAINYLDRYLEHYLNQKDLWFDQGSAMAALAFIGTHRGEDLVTPYRAAWDAFVSNKPNWNLASSIEDFAQQMQSLNEFKAEINNK